MVKGCHLGAALIICAFLLQSTWGEQPIVVDKAMCEKMISLGKAAFDKGDFKQAKLYYRKAIQADPYSMRAWLYYDAASKAEAEKKLSLSPPPAASMTGAVPPGAPVAAPPPPSPPAEQKEEGC